MTTLNVPVNPDVKAEEAAENPKAKTNEEEQSLIKRYGPKVQEYLIEFCVYLTKRTGFKFESFTAPIHLQKAMQKMEKFQLSTTIWNTFINVAMRILALKNMEFTSRKVFIEGLMFVVSMVVDYYLEYFSLRLILRVITCFAPGKLTAVIIFIYRVLHFGSEKVWDYVEKKIKEYSMFIFEKLQPLSTPRLQ